MKKLFLVLLPVLFLFSACKYEPPCYSIAVSIKADDDTITNKNWTYIKTKVGAEIHGYYDWIPFDPKDPSIENVVSTDENIISITSVDFDKQTFTALAKQSGTAKIRVIVNESKKQFSSAIEFVVTN